MMKDVNGNHVKEVRVSDATRADARGQPDRQSIIAAITECQDEGAAIGVRQRQIEARLGIIKNSIRGRRLHPDEYRRLVDEQNALTTELKANNSKGAELRLRFNRLTRDLEGHEKKDKLVETNELLRKILAELEILNGRRRAT